MKNERTWAIFLSLILALLFVISPLRAEESAADLAKKSQNPVAAMISLPIQYNINFETGPKAKTQNIVLVQPVVPIGLITNGLCRPAAVSVRFTKSESNPSISQQKPTTTWKLQKPVQIGPYRFRCNCCSRSKGIEMNLF